MSQSRRPPHQQGSNRPQAIFYFVRERPELLTGVRAAQIIADHLEIAIRETEPGRFENFLGIVEDDPRVSSHQRTIPNRPYALPGEVKRWARPEALAILQEKLAHLRIPGTPSYRAPYFHTEALCVLYVGSPAFLLFNARHNLEETGVLRQKWMDFSVVADDLLPCSESSRARRATTGLPPTYLHIDCFEKERFNADNFDEVARRLGLRGKKGGKTGEFLSTEELIERLGVEEPCN